MSGETRSTVLLAGVGTAGSCAAEALMRQLSPSGLTLIMVDPDRVEPHNVPKSALFGYRDVGRLKVDAAAGQLRRIRPDASLVAVPYPLQALGAGPFRICDLAISALDNRVAKLHFNRMAQAAGVPHALVVEFAGGGSFDCRLRRYAPASESGPCLECGWSRDEYAQIEQLQRPCALPEDTTRPCEPLSPALRLAAEVVDEVEHCLSGQPGLAPGQELRMLPAGRCYLTLRTLTNPDCLCSHGPVTPLVTLDGDEAKYTVGQFVADVTSTVGQGWTWHLPGPAVIATCPTCGRSSGLIRLGLDAASNCPYCRQQSLPDPSGLTNTVTAANLALMENLKMADVWPAGDILRLASAAWRDTSRWIAAVESSGHVAYQGDLRRR